MADVSEWNIRVKSRGDDCLAGGCGTVTCSGAVAGCGAAAVGEYIGIGAVGCDSVPGLMLGLDPVVDETELNICVNAPGWAEMAGAGAAGAAGEEAGCVSDC